MGKALYIVRLLLAVALGFVLGQSQTQRKSNLPGSRRLLYYVDPMHPTYKSDKPGLAPDCGMPLEAVYADESTPSPGSVLPTKLSVVAENRAEQQQLFGIPIVAVETTPIKRTLHLHGRVVVDETRVFHINVGADGFVKRVYDHALGSRVRKDQRLATFYAPEFLSAEGSYLAAVERPPAAILQAQKGTRSAADRLRALGMSDFQLKEIAQTKKISDEIYVVSPVDGFIVGRTISEGLKFEKEMEFYRIADLSQVGIVAELFGREAHQFPPGALARITLPDQKHNLWARVSRVLPQVDPSTRGVQLRLEADNPNLALRPDMFVDVDLPLAVPPGLSVPADAVLDLGLSQRVFVERGEGWFEPREVETGERFGDRVQIVRGLAAGEKVVASGTFMVDSESRLKTADPILEEPERNRHEPGDASVKQSSVTPDQAPRGIDSTRPAVQKVQKAVRTAPTSAAR